MANRTPPEVEALVLALSLELPAYGQVRIANELRKRGQTLSPAGVRGVWQRNDLETMQKRLKALEAKVAQDGIILTEAQLAALEKAKTGKEARGEFESECPGYCGAQDTFCLGDMKGVGRIYQRECSIFCVRFSRSMLRGKDGVDHGKEDRRGGSGRTA